ncbi:Spermatoproteinsis associated protein 5 [Sparganum proliferum]
MLCFRDQRFRCAKLFSQSLLFRLQNTYIMLGSTVRLRILGADVEVRFVAVRSKTGLVTTEESSELSTVASDNKSTNAIDSRKFEEFESVTFSDLDESFVVYKVSSTTAIEVLDVQSADLGKQSVPPSNAVILPIGLEPTCFTVIEFLRQFSFSSWRKPCPEPTGLLLYGLQGCGKTRCLSSLATQKCVLDVSTKETLGAHNWYNRLKFVTLTSDTCPTSIRLRKTHLDNHFRDWLSEQLSADPLRPEHTGLVLVLPDFDQWPSSLCSRDGDDAPETSTVHEKEIFAAFCAGLRRLAASLPPVCVLATCTDCKDLMNHRDLRNLFYRQILVALPNGEQRRRILEDELLSCYSVVLSNTDAENCRRLSQLSASLHGYTSADLRRILRAAYAAALVDKMSGRPEVVGDNDLPNAGDGQLPTASPNLAEIIDRLEAEARHYRPANLSAEISLFSPMRWSDIGGYADIKRMLSTAIQQRLLDSADPQGSAALTNRKLGLGVPRGVLLHGPPGCSKTLFVRALATECNLPLVAVQASRIFGRYVGDSERNMQRILVHARACAPAILFIDEIDLLLPSRSSSESGVSEHVLGEVLTAMDGVEGQCGQLLLIAATNRLENLDPALRRAGRFDITITVPPPDAEARCQILRIELSKRSTAACVLQPDWLAAFARDRLLGYTGAEVVAVVQRAAELARETPGLEIGRHQLETAQACVPPSTLEAYLRQTDSSQQTFMSEETPGQLAEVRAGGPPAARSSNMWQQQLQQQDTAYFSALPSIPHSRITVSAILVALLSALICAYSLILHR